MLWDSAEGPCLHRPENWFVSQLNDEPRPVYKVGFIREKGKATARELQWSPEASSSLLRWRLMFELWVWVGVRWALFIGCGSAGFLRWTGLFAPYWWGKQSWDHFAHQSCGRSMRPCISSSGRRNAVYSSFSGCKSQSSLYGEWNTHSSALVLQTHHIFHVCFSIIYCAYFVIIFLLISFFLNDF
jgi:hypothetical protein